MNSLKHLATSLALILALSGPLVATPAAAGNPGTDAWICRHWPFFCNK